MIILPFNYQPASSVVKTGSYNIPSGKYAYVIASCRDGGTFSIDGTVALESVASLIAVAVGGTSDPQTYNVPAGRIFEGQLWGNVNITATVGGSQISSALLNQLQGIKAGPGQAVSVSTGGVDAKSITGYARALTQDGPVVEGFWVPTGTALTLSGSTRYTVMEFNELT